ncbi:MAG TPA: hypothetical protein VNG90_01165 [Candidatus Acidoferrum sp.]|nr:hypothetical protein [Candidatus Acidoferrum sp.]
MKLPKLPKTRWGRFWMALAIVELLALIMNFTLTRQRYQPGVWQDYTVNPIIASNWDYLTWNKGHPWDFRPYDQPITHSAHIAGDPRAPGTNTILGPLVIDFLWWTVVEFKLADPAATSSWHLGYVSGGAFYCTVMLRPDQTVGSFVGPGDAAFFAIDDQGRNIPLVLVSRTSKWDAVVRGILLV